MAFLQWRRFNFFDKEVVKDPTGGKPFEFLKDVTISASACGRGQMIFGDIEGNLHFLSRQLEIGSFKAYAIRVSHLYQLKQYNILVSIGEDEEGINPLIKVWNLEKVDRMGFPTCSRIERAIPGSKPTRVTCLTVNENLNYMAVGFETGAVVLFKGDVTRDRHSKQQVIFEGSHPITSLYFTPMAQNKTSLLYITTENQVFSFSLNPKQKDNTLRVLDENGCKIGCSAMSDPLYDSQFIIGRTEAVYFYAAEERGQCLAFEGEKLSLQWFRGYLVIVGKEKKAIPMAGPAKSIDMHLVTVYDVSNKFIAYSGPVPEVSQILCEWGSLYCVGGDGKMYLFQEKDTQTKLEILFKKNLYQLAIDLAQGQQYDQEGIIEIFTQYGDHLYAKGDHDGAIQQYIKTIGTLEASYVIRKFLDAQRIHNLTAYLQALHQAHLATEDHTTLLLNCYTKLKDVKKLDEFIKSEERDFDVETAIKVCRAAGYSEHALYLAEKHKQHESYLKIQVEDIHDYEGALKYMSTLPFYEAQLNVKKYGKELMAQEPAKTTEFLKRLCTGYTPTPGNDIIPDIHGDIVEKANAEEYIHVFVNNPEKLTEFLQHMVQAEPQCSVLVYNTLLELYLHDLAHEPDMSKRVERERLTLDLLQSKNAGYDLDQALVLCQMNNFKAGILFLYEKAKLYQQILKYHIDEKSTPHIISSCKRFGNLEPNLWIQALSYFAGREEDCKAQITEVLTHIEKSNLLPPLLVIQTLAHNSTAKLGVIKEYITRRLQAEQQLIEEDKRLIKQYQSQSDQMRAKIEELKTSATIFNVSKCSVCSHPLDLPSVHFLCQHSYHQHCYEGYSESESECPVCSTENRKVLEIIKAQEENKDLHEQFHHQLERSQDGFGVIADYFGRGVFNKVTLITEPSPEQAARPKTNPVISSQRPKAVTAFPTHGNNIPPSMPLHSLTPDPPASAWRAGRDPVSVAPVSKLASSSAAAVAPASRTMSGVTSVTNSGGVTRQMDVKPKVTPASSRQNSAQSTASQKSAAPSYKNPFDEHESTNPFDEPSPSNPFDDDKNPFNEDTGSKDRYPKEHNPFE